MKDWYRRIIFGFFGGVLITLGCCFVAAFWSFYVWSHHMYMIGFQWPRAALALLLPVALIGGGTTCLVRAFRSRRA